MKKPRETKRSSDEAVRARTGKVWAEWFKILDKAGAKEMAHQEISAFLRVKQGVGSWWAQMVSVAYERERGLRQKFQKCDGEFSASSSRTLAVPLARAYAAWTDEKLREKWLPHAPMEITTATPGKSLRAKWNGDTRLSVNFYGRGAKQAQVAVDHMKLASSRNCAKMKSYWFAALNRLRELLEA